MKDRLPLFLYAALAILLLSSAVPTIKAALGSCSPLSIAALRFFFASLGLLVIAGSPQGKSLEMPQPRHWLLFLLLASLGIVSYHILLNWGTLLTDAGTAVFTVYTAPIITLLFSWAFLGEQMRGLRIIGCVIALCGIYAIVASSGGGLALTRGVPVLFVGAVLWSLFLTLQKALRKHYSAFSVTSISIWLATAMYLLIAPPSYLFHTVAHGGVRAFLLIVYLGLAPTCVGYLLWNHVLGKMEVSRASIYMYFIPFLASGISQLFLGEAHGHLFYLGGGAIILGILIAEVRPKKRVNIELSGSGI